MTDANDLPRVGQRWQHYKGAIYRIALLGMLEESGSPAVCYQALNGDGRVWISTLAEFLGTVMPGGVETQRFTRVED